LRDFADAVGLLVPHLVDGGLVAVCDANCNLLTSSFYLFRCPDWIVRIFRAGNRNGLGNQTLRAAQIWVTGIVGV
jgi:hypothetical protein